MVAPSDPINAKEYAATLPGTTWEPDSNYAVGSESDRVKIIDIQTESSVNVKATGVAFNTTETFTLVKEVNEGINHGSKWALVNPSNATAKIVVTFDGDPTNAKAVACYYSDAEQVIPVEGVSSNSDSGTAEVAIATDVVTLGDDRMISATGGLGDGVLMVVGTGETLIHEDSTGSSSIISSFFVQASSGTRTMDYTFAAARRPNIIAVAIRPVAAAGAILLRRSALVYERHNLTR